MSAKAPQTSAQRQAVFRAAQRNLGRKRAEFWVTPKEEAALIEALAALRSGGGRRPELP